MISINYFFVFVNKKIRDFWKPVWDDINLLRINNRFIHTCPLNFSRVTTLRAIARWPTRHSSVAIYCRARRPPRRRRRKPALRTRQSCSRRQPRRPIGTMLWLPTQSLVARTRSPLTIRPVVDWWCDCKSTSIRRVAIFTKKEFCSCCVCRARFRRTWNRIAYFRAASRRD